MIIWKSRTVIQVRIGSNTYFYYEQTSKQFKRQIDSGPFKSLPHYLHEFPCYTYFFLALLCRGRDLQNMTLKRWKVSYF